jgi:hypothetical protein
MKNNFLSGPCYRRHAGHHRGPATVTAVRIDRRWADEAALAATYDALRAWGEHPDAYQAVMMCEAIDWVDEGGA